MSLILLLSCVSPELTQRESIEWVEMAHTGDLLSARWVRSNTGLLKNQSHLRLNYFKSKQNPIEYSFHAPESEQIWQEQNLQIGTHSLKNEDKQWKMNIHDDEFNLRLETNSTSKPSCQFESEDWSVEIISLQSKDNGWLQSQKRSISLQGESFLIKHKGHRKDSAPHRWLLIQSSSLQVFYEDWGDFQYGCANKDGKLTTLSEKDIEWTDTGVKLSLPKETINVLWRKNLGVEDPYQHLIQAERWVASSSFPLDSIHWFQGYAQDTSSSHFYPAVFRYQGSTPPKIKQRKTKPAFPNSKKSDSDNLPTPNSPEK